MSPTQYFEFQEDQYMTRLLYFTRTYERGREGVLVSFGIEEMRSLYSSGGENMNEMSFNDG